MDKSQKLVAIFNNAKIREQEQEILRLRKLLDNKENLLEKLQKKEAEIERKNNLIMRQWELISSLRKN